MLDDSIKLNLYLAGDNWIQETDIDSSISLTFSQPASDAVAHFSTATYFTQTVWLTAGAHVLHVTVQNYTSAISGNGTGIDVYGTLTSVSATNSLKAETAHCDSIVLSAPSVAPSRTNVSLFPNPATTSLTISAPTGINTIAISNLLGQTVYTNSYNSEIVLVDISTLAAGIYFVRVNGSEVRKFLKE